MNKRVKRILVENHMTKCDYCANEELLPYVCSYCGKRFCVKHRTPESHECSLLPKGPLLWHQKKQLAEKEYLREKTHDICPKCRSEFVGVSSFNEEKVSYSCSTCGHTWTMPRKKVT